jgi:DNA-binding MurR/RpiR family transcriptional regulator
LVKESENGSAVKRLMRSYIERIQDARSELSPSFERLADFLLDSYAQAALLTATEIGHSLDIDTATVVRFAQHLGYKGYPDLQREIRGKLKRELLGETDSTPNSSTEAVDSALQELVRGLELTRKGFPIKEAECLINELDVAQRIILLAEGLGLGPARNLAASLEAAGYNIHLAGGSLSDIARALAGARHGDLLIAVVIDDETPYLSAALSEAKSAGVCCTALVASLSSAAAEHADITLAAYKTSQPGANQFMVEAMIYALIRMITRVRPGRFENNEGHVARIRDQLTKEEEC